MEDITQTPRGIEDQRISHICQPNLISTCSIRLLLSAGIMPLEKRSGKALAHRARHIYNALILFRCAAFLLSEAAFWMRTRLTMERDNHTIWAVWANCLQNWGLGNLVAVLLETAGPLKLLGAQLVYLGQPTLKGLLPNEQLSALATLLENDTYSSSFAKILQEEET